MINKKKCPGKPYRIYQLDAFMGEKIYGNPVSVGILTVDIVKEVNDYKVIITQGKSAPGKQRNHGIQDYVIVAPGLPDSDIKRSCSV